MQEGNNERDCRSEIAGAENSAKYLTEAFTRFSGQCYKREHVKYSLVAVRGQIWPLMTHKSYHHLLCKFTQTQQISPIMINRTQTQI